MTRGGFRISRHVVAGLVAVAALVVPAQAGAATVGVIGDTLAIAGGSESSNLAVTRSGPSLVVTDSALTVSGGDRCSPAGNGKRVVCSATGVNRIVAVLLDGNDKLDWSAVSVPTSFYGGNGNDTAVGGTGTDNFDLGAGDDSITARDGNAESLNCGAGADRGSADANDTLAADCESDVARPNVVAPPADAPAVDAPAVDPATDDPAAPDAGPGDPVDDDPAVEDPATAQADAPVTIEVPPLLQATANGDIQIGVGCTAPSGACVGSIAIIEQGGVVKSVARVTTARRGRRAAIVKGDRKAVVLGRARFSVAAGQTETVTVRLTRAGRQRIIKKKKRRTRAKLVVTVVAPDGTRSTSVKVVTIAIPQERRTTGRVKPKPPPKGRRKR
ncbi:MAG: hypothetical protein QOJ12_1339 [Thermoleophilales bacterium]|nr:hypothetical protein [Thermoleophilales bacterium]